MTPYQFITLRYRHDAITGEFVNIGVVLLSEDRQLEARFSPRISRLRQLFGDLQKTNHKQLLGYLQRRFDKAAEEVQSQLPEMQESLKDLAYSLLPPDNSAYQWSEIQQGLTQNAADEIQHLFDRLVCRYENRTERSKRTDDEVWSSFNTVLREKRLAVYLKEKKLETQDYSYNFNHSYKNGVYHLYEPLAFEHDDLSKIAEKAIRWQGRGNALSGAEPHKFWFLIGDVEGSKRINAVDKAINLLNQIPTQVQIVRESEKGAFADELESMVNSTR